MSAKVFRLLSLVLVATMLAGLVACQGTPATTATQPPAKPTEAETVATAVPATEAVPPTAPAEERVLKIWHYESATGAMGQSWEAAIKEFEATHPGVKVEADTTRGFEQIRQTASMILNSDEAPDVMEYNKGNATAGMLSQQGLLTNMTDEVVKRGWDKILAGGLQTTCRYENGVMGSGDWYGVTNYGEFVLVYYNKALFAQNGIAVPTTLEEMEAAMDKFVAAGLIPIATGATEYPAQHIFYELVLSQADRAFVDDFELYKNPVDFHGPEFTFGAERLAEWVKKGYIDKNATSLGAEDMGLAFEGGKYPMMISGSWWYGRLMSEIKDFEWGVFLFPGNKLNAGSGGNLWIVPENSKNKDLAYDFIDLTLRQDIQTIMGNAGGLPVNADLTQVTDPKVKELIQAFNDFSAGAAFYPDWPAAGFYDNLVSNVQELIGGTMTPAQMLDALAAFYTENKPK